MENIESSMWIEDPDGYLSEINDTRVEQTEKKKKESKKLRNVVIVAASTAGVIFAAAAGYLFYSNSNSHKNPAAGENGETKTSDSAKPSGEN